MRVLDLDLDFFLHERAHYLDGSNERPDPDEYPPWSFDLAMHFLTDHCLLDGPRPGFVVEQHNELFYLWGEAIEVGRLAAPLEVVHVDAHADLGLGDASYVYVMNELVFEPMESRYEILKRRRPSSRGEMLELGNHALADSNWLMFALACGWIGGLTYVCNSFAKSSVGARPGDLARFLMKDFDTHADHLQLVGTREEAFEWAGTRPREIEHREPPIPFTFHPWREYQATEPFDVICLTRSPQYTPTEIDSLFDAIRERFIDEEVWS